MFCDDQRKAYLPRVYEGQNGSMRKLKITGSNYPAAAIPAASGRNPTSLIAREQFRRAVSGAERN